jgi:O-antigen ligase
VAVHIGAVSAAQWFERMALGALLLLLGVSALPLAGNRPWLVAGMALSLWALLAMVLCLRASVGVSLRAQWHDAPLGALGLLAFTALVAWQLGPWGYSADAFMTKVYLLRCLASLAAFVLVVLLVRGRRRLLAMAGVLVVAGVVQALLAIALYAADARYVFLGHAFDQGQRAMGTFANPDHLAHYLGLCLSTGVGLMLARAPRPGPPARNWRMRVVKALEFLMSPAMLLRLMLVIMVIALVLTRSRMGNGAFFVALLVLGLAAMAAWPGQRRLALWLVITMLLVDVLIIGQWVGLDKVVGRISGTQVMAQVGPEDVSGEAAFREESLQERLQAPVQALALVAQRPWAGHGGGAFYTVFPQVKGVDRPWRFDHAHNDYVEIAVDTGLIGLAVLGAWMGLTLWRLARLMHRDQPRHRRGLAAGVLMAISCMLLHSVVDFNLQVTANALTLTVLVAMAWAMPLALRQSGSKRQDFQK